MKRLSVEHTEYFKVNAPIDEVFGFIVDKDVLPKIHRQYSLIPSVSSTTIYEGNWDTPGSYRTVHFTNGTMLREVLNHYDPPDCFSYTVSEFSGFQKLLATHVQAQWLFEYHNDITYVSWTCIFHARSRLNLFIMRRFLNTNFKKFMRRSIKLIKDQVEKDLIIK